MGKQNLENGIQIKQLTKSIDYHNYIILIIRIINILNDQYIDNYVSGNKSYLVDSTYTQQLLEESMSSLSSHY
jgi:hypothetical protein